jgi:hypothetical protein
MGWMNVRQRGIYCCWCHPTNLNKSARFNKEKMHSLALHITIMPARSSTQGKNCIIKTTKPRIQGLPLHCVKFRAGIITHHHRVLNPSVRPSPIMCAMVVWYFLRASPTP